MKFHELKKRRLNLFIIVLVDILIVAVAYIGAYLIRFEGKLSYWDWVNVRNSLPLLGAARIAFNYSFGLYRGMWRYTSFVDIFNILKASLSATIFVVGGLLIFNRFEGYSRSVFIIDFVLAFLLTSGCRTLLRLYFQGTFSFWKPAEREHRKTKKRILVIGAGNAADKLVREIFDNPTLPYRVVGFLDDNTAKTKLLIHGIPVLGTIEEINEAIIKTSAHEILIAIPSANRDQMNRIIELCRSTCLPYKTIPGLGEMINGKVSVKSIRDVSYKDLLGRPPVKLELDQINEVLRHKKILITGAGGSIGSELCRQLVKFDPELLLFLDLSEENLYRIEMEILHEFNFSRYEVILGKVQDKDLLEKIFSFYQPEVVFHAAAYKHVPMLEKNPWEGVFNNVFAARRLIRAALTYNVERFILVSTDKAVRPTNVMGATKRLIEMLMLANNGRKTQFMAVRFGNVIGSSGSVIPLFRRQIEMGGPVTVTHQDITRFFMSIEEAAQLILQAASMGEGGEIFILEMGTPVRIAQMARDLIRLCGKEPDREIEIKYIGLRPGEKLFEELIIEGEGIVHSEHEKILVLKPGQHVSLETLDQGLNKLKTLARLHDAAGIKRVLRELVPEYAPKESASIFPNANEKKHLDISTC